MGIVYFISFFFFCEISIGAVIHQKIRRKFQIVFFFAEKKSRITSC